MPNPVSLISAFPPDELKEFILSQNKYNRLNVFIDLKNVLQSLYIPSIIDEIVANSQTMSNIDSTIFQSILNIISYWKNYGRYKGMRTYVYITTDIGRSQYHRDIYQKYKNSRYITNTKYGPNNVKLIEIRDNNFKLAEKVINKIQNAHFFCLDFLESDFVPYYLLSRNFVYHDDSTLNIICSNDKDLYQTTEIPNTIIVYKKFKYRDLLTKNDVLKFYTGINKTKTKRKEIRIKILDSLDMRYITTMMAIVGDVADDIPGVSGIGLSKVIDLFEDESMVSTVLGSVDDINDRIFNNGKLFIDDMIGISKLPNFAWKSAMINNDLVTRSYKLISFEQLSRWLDNENSLFKTNSKNYMINIIEKSNIPLIENMSDLVSQLFKLEDFQLEERVIHSLGGA